MRFFSEYLRWDYKLIIQNYPIYVPGKASLCNVIADDLTFYILTFLSEAAVAACTMFMHKSAAHCRRYIHLVSELLSIKSISVRQVQWVRRILRVICYPDYWTVFRSFIRNRPSFASSSKIRILHYSRNRSFKVALMNTHKMFDYRYRLWILLPECRFKFDSSPNVWFYFHLNDVFRYRSFKSLNFFSFGFTYLIPHRFKVVLYWIELKPKTNDELVILQFTYNIIWFRGFLLQQGNKNLLRNRIQWSDKNLFSNNLVYEHR